MTSSLAHRDGLRVLQQAVYCLASWVGVSPPIDPFSQPLEASSVVEELLGWPSQADAWKSHVEVQPLQVIFDSVALENSQSKRVQHTWSAYFFEDNVKSPTIPYPTQDTVNLDDLKPPIREAIAPLSEADWQNFSLLLLLIEKFAAYLSVGKQADISLLDWTRTTAAVAAALANQPDAKKLALVSGDLSGIQNFIYTIASDGALKSLRARSFYLELVTHEVVEQLLEILGVPRTNVIYAGGGNLYLLVSGNNASELDSKIKVVQKKLNRWLKEEFQGKVFLALDFNCFPLTAIASSDFSQAWEATTKKLAPQKSQKFKHQLEEILQVREAYDPCKVCHRDDTPNLKPLNPNEPDSSLACPTCRNMFKLGSILFKVEAIARTNTPEIPGALYWLKCGESYYHLFETPKQAQAVQNADYFLINNWTLADYKTANTSLMLLGNYGCRIQDEDEGGRESFIHSRAMAKRARGLQRFACLRMDVDRLGQIFAKGLGDKQTLPRLAGLSRQMSYFFKVYLNSLAAVRNENLPQNAKSLSPDLRQNLLFIYAGGDDLFVTGSWNAIVEFFNDIYQAFRAYTGYNQDVTLSGGISLHEPKFPLYLAAKQSGEAEESAKGNGRDSLGLFGEVFKWEEWLGISQREWIDSDLQAYLQDEAKPELFGVFPLVEQLKQQQMDINYARSFVRNLLNTANLQAQILQEFEDNRRKPQYANERQDIRCYLHLPRIAYTLSRLPAHVRTADSFKPVRTSLKNPRNSPYFKAIATWLELLNRTS